MFWSDIGISGFRVKPLALVLYSRLGTRAARHHDRAAQIPQVLGLLAIFGSMCDSLALYLS